MKKIMLTFDLEEFDITREYGEILTPENEFTIGHESVEDLLLVLKKHQVVATFFTTANFAMRFPALIQEIATTHEIASHAYMHTGFDTEDYLKSKMALENIIGKKVLGFRMPRLAPVDFGALKEAGYVYDSSINPTWIPGKYNHFKKSKFVYANNGIQIVPTAVTPFFRIPMFWLMFKNCPLKIYSFFLKLILKTNQPVCLYLHPWEFSNIEHFSCLPKYVRNPCGKQLLTKLDNLLNTFSTRVEFCSVQQYLNVI
jgi:hypothetical protein